MIKLIEVCTIKATGEMKECTKSFTTRKQFEKSLQNSPLDGHLCYELRKKGEAIIDYEDARVHIKVVDTEEKGKLILLP